MSENKYTNEFFEEFERKMNTANKIEAERKSTAFSRGKRKGVRVAGLAISLVAFLLVAAIVIGLLWPPATPVPESADNNTSDVVEKEPEKPIFKIFETENTTAFAYDIKSEHGVLIDASTGEIIYKKNASDVIYPASLTKILTLLVAVENIEDLDDTFTMTSEIIDPHYRVDASMAGFAPDEVITVRDLLYGAILPSGADATTALGIYVAGTEEAFATLMNEKVKELGLTTAHFCNTSGLHDTEHYCTVGDIAVILKAAMENETCKKILSTYQYTTSATEQNPEGILLTSTLFSRMKGDEPEGAEILAGKTGFTDEAGNCIASFGTTDDGRQVIMVTTNAQGKWPCVFDHIHTYSTLCPEAPSQDN